MAPGWRDRAVSVQAFEADLSRGSWRDRAEPVEEELPGEYDDLAPRLPTSDEMVDTGKRVGDWLVPPEQPGDAPVSMGRTAAIAAQRVTGLDEADTNAPPRVAGSPRGLVGKLAGAPLPPQVPGEPKADELRRAVGQNPGTYYTTMGVLEAPELVVGAVRGAARAGARAAERRSVDLGERAVRAGELEVIDEARDNLPYARRQAARGRRNANAEGTPGPSVPIDYPDYPGGPAAEAAARAENGPGLVRRGVARATRVASDWTGRHAGASASVSGGVGEAVSDKILRGGRKASGDLQRSASRAGDWAYRLREIGGRDARMVEALMTRAVEAGNVEVAAAGLSRKFPDLAEEIQEAARTASEPLPRDPLRVPARKVDVPTTPIARETRGVEAQMYPPGTLTRDGYDDAAEVRRLQEAGELDERGYFADGRIERPDGAVESPPRFGESRTPRPADYADELGENQTGRGEPWDRDPDEAPDLAPEELMARISRARQQGRELEAGELEEQLERMAPRGDDSDLADELEGESWERWVRGGSPHAAPGEPSYPPRFGESRPYENIAAETERAEGMAPGRGMESLAGPAPERRAPPLRQEERDYVTQRAAERPGTLTRIDNEVDLRARIARLREQGNTAEADRLDRVLEGGGIPQGTPPPRPVAPRAPERVTEEGLRREWGRTLPGGDHPFTDSRREFADAIRDEHQRRTAQQRRGPEPVMGQETDDELMDMGAEELRRRAAAMRRAGDEDQASFYDDWAEQADEVEADMAAEEGLDTGWQGPVPAGARVAAEPTEFSRYASGRRAEMDAESARVRAQNEAGPWPNASRRPSQPGMDAIAPRPAPRARGLAREARAGQSIILPDGSRATVESAGDFGVTIRSTDGGSQWLRHGEYQMPPTDVAVQDVVGRVMGDQQIVSEDAIESTSLGSRIPRGDERRRQLEGALAAARAEGRTAIAQRIEQIIAREFGTRSDARVKRDAQPLDSREVLRRYVQVQAKKRGAGPRAPDRAVAGPAGGPAPSPEKRREAFRMVHEGGKLRSLEGARKRVTIVRDKEGLPVTMEIEEL